MFKSKRQRTASNGAALAALLLLSACGGGSGGTDTTAEGTPLSNDTAIQENDGSADHTTGISTGTDTDSGTGNNNASEELFVTGDGCISTETLEAEILRLINEIRSQAQTCGNVEFSPAPAVSWNERLEGAALIHSEDMANNNFFDHQGTDSSMIGDRATMVEYNWRRIAENIAAGQQTIEHAVEGWMNSPPHCSSIMNSSYFEVGVSCHDNEASAYDRYWTMVLGQSRN